MADRLTKERVDDLLCDEAMGHADAARRMLCGLIARIDGDGGHAQEGKTLEENCARANQIAATRTVDLDAARAEVAALKAFLVKLGERSAVKIAMLGDGIYMEHLSGLGLNDFEMRHLRGVAPSKKRKGGGK